RAEATSSSDTWVSGSAPHGCPGRHGAVQDGNVRYRSDLVTPPSSPQRRPATVRENRDWWRMEGTVLNLARLNIWSSRRRPGSRQGKGAPLRADASTPAPQTPPSVRAEATSSSDTWVSGSAPHGCPGRHGAVQDGNVRYRSDLVTPPSSPQRRPATVRENRDWWRMEGTVLNLARLNIWSSRRRPGSRQGKGAPLRADASTPAPQTPPSVRAEATSSSDTWVSGSAPQPHGCPGRHHSRN